MKYFLTAVIVASSLCSYEPFRTTTPSQSEIFLKNCYCNWLSLPVQAFSGPQHPPKMKYFLKAVIVTGSLLICIGLLGPQHPPAKVKYSLQNQALYVCIGLSGPVPPSHSGLKIVYKTEGKIGLKDTIQHPGIFAIGTP